MIETIFKNVAVLAVGLVSGFFRALGWRACRFHPSCSQYARDAFEGEIFFKALWLSVRRILRCHPFSAGGYDPVSHPLKKES